MVMDKLCAIIHQHLVNCRATSQYLYSDQIVLQHQWKPESVSNIGPVAATSLVRSFSSAFSNATPTFTTFGPRTFHFPYSQYIVQKLGVENIAVARFSIMLLIGRLLILTESKKVVESASSLIITGFVQPAAPVGRRWANHIAQSSFIGSCLMSLSSGIPNQNIVKRDQTKFC